MSGSNNAKHSLKQLYKKESDITLALYNEKKLIYSTDGKPNLNTIKKFVEYINIKFGTSFRINNGG